MTRARFKNERLRILRILSAELVKGKEPVDGGRWTEVGGRWSVVSGQWSVVSGRWLVVGGRWSVVSG